MKNKKIFVFFMAVCMLIMSLPAFAEGEVKPKITKTSIKNEATEVSPVNFYIDVNFSESMDASTLKNTCVIFSPDVRVSVDVLSGTSIRVYTQKLSTNTEYSVTFKNSIKSQNGVPIDATTIKFTTVVSAPEYRQISFGDMENISGANVAFTDVDSNTQYSFVKEKENTVMKFTAGWAQAPMAQQVSITPGKQYTARAMVKSEKANNMWFVLCYTTDSKPADWYHQGGSKSVSNEWTELTATFKVPEDIQNQNILLRLIADVNGSTVYIDDWQFFEDGYDIDNPNVAAKKTSDTVKTYISDEPDKNVQMLKAFGIYGSEYKDDSSVTRDYLAQYASKLVGANEMLPTYNFSDIDSDSYEGYAGTASALMLMTGYEDGTFRPNDDATAESAIGVILKTLGYNSMIGNGILSTASSIGLLKGVTINDIKSSIKYSELTLLIANALEIQTIRTKSDLSKTGYGKILLEENLKLTKSKGIIESTKETSLLTGDGVANNCIVIDGKTYFIGCDASDYIGQKVTYYTKEINGTDYVLFITDMNKYNKILNIDSVNIEDYKEGKYSYVDKATNKVKTVKIENNKYLIYNGRSVSSYNDQALISKNGNVVLIDNNNNGIYDVIKVTNYETFVVQSVDYNEGIVVDKFENKKMEIDLDENVQVYLNGKTAKFTDILPWNVLSIAKSLDGKLSKIYISNNKFSHKISAINNDEELKKVEFYDAVHGKQLLDKYYCVPNYSGTNEFYIGAQGIFYLDFLGRIAAFNGTESGFMFGYIKCAYVSSDEKLNIKLFAQNNKMETHEASSNVKIDGKSYKAASKAYGYLTNSGVNQLIRYKVNDGGIITSIETLNNQNTERSRFRLIKSGSSKEYNYASKTIGKEVALKDNVSVFCLPENPAAADDTDFWSADISYLSNEKTYSYSAYSVTESNLLADVIVLNNNLISNYDYKQTGIVSKIVDRWDDKFEENCTSYTVINANGETGFNTFAGVGTIVGYDGTAQTIEKGDIVSFRTDRLGRMYDATVIFKGKTKTLLSEANPTITEYDKINRAIFGPVTDKDGAYLSIKGNTTEVINTDLYGTLYEYDTKDNKLNKISVSDVMDLAHGSEPSLAFAIDDWKLPILFVIYK